MNDEIRKQKKREAASRYYHRNKEKINAKMKEARLKDIEAHRAKHRKYSKAYVLRNPEKRKESIKKYYSSNRQKCLNASVASNRKKRDRNPEKYRENCRNYFHSNSEKWREYFRNYARQFRKTPRGKIASKIRGRIWSLIKSKNVSVTKTRVKADMILVWFEWLKAKGYADWTADGIHIDHVIPVSAFKIEKDDAMEACNSWKNLFPLNASANMSKGDKIIPNYYRMVRGYVHEFLSDNG